ncbi:GNAT family N-acetyltransferase [Chlorogloeopsis sp. ULAP02]|uniref:GNAT family N-acetyltransferase n=1 Tax=Chlorogloeopsis sp. ULAP02 TaxID=3107926 RepID=UPI003136E1B9
MEKSWTIREAEEIDIAAIAQVHVASWKSTYHGLIPASVIESYTVEHRETIWAKILAQGKTKTLVIADKNIFGFVNFGATRDSDKDIHQTAEINAIYLLASHWGRKLGKVVLEQAIQDILAQGFHEITLWVLDSNTRARRFYAALGFDPDGASKLDVRGDASLTELRYCRVFS